jgi:siderophore synthetase component
MREDTRRPWLRTDAERAAFGVATRYARVHDLGMPPERPYLEALSPARSDVRDRFVAGLLRGDPAGLSAPTFLDVGAERPAAALPFDPDDGIPTAESATLAVLNLSGAGRALTAPVAEVLAFDRVRVADPVCLVGPDGTARVDHPVDLVAPLSRAGAFADADQAETVRAELAECVANLALALLAERVQAARAPDTVLDAAADRLPAADRPAYLERLVTRGHPLHPAAKIRRGMSPAEGLAYAPEFAPRVDLRFVAVREDVARRTGVDDRSLTDRLFAAFDGLEAAAHEALPDAGGYAVVPVHPWQYHQVLPERYDRPMADGRVVPVEGYTVPATPLLNLRTVVPDVAGPTPHVKLPVGVQTTNVERTLSPQAVHNGPRVTRLWRAVADRESFGTLGALEEPAAASYYLPGGPHTDGGGYDDARHLGALVRRNPREHPLAAGDARPVPAASLVAGRPEGGPLVAAVLDRYGERHEHGDAGDAARSFLAAYLDAVVPAQLRLLCKYGVALESHLQNCVVVFERWRPTAVLVRDFGGIRVLDGRLTPHGLSLEPFPDSDLDADGATDLHWKLYYALFQNHLAELVATLVEETPLARGDAWTEVATVCRDAFDRLRADGDVPDARVDADEAALFADPLPYKALTAMRLQGKRHEYVTSRVSNPLTGFDER